MKCPREYCGAEWQPRVPNPVKCPRCQQPLNPPTATKHAAEQTVKPSGKTSRKKERVQ